MGVSGGLNNPPRNFRPTVVLKKEMATPTPKSTAIRPLWVIAFALVTIAVCLVALVVKKQSSQGSLAQSNSSDQAIEPALPPESATQKTSQKPRLVQTGQIAKPAPAKPNHELPPPIDIPVANEQPIPVETPTPPTPSVSGGLAPLTGRGGDQSGGTITGRVVLKGTPPPEKVIEAIAADVNCGKLYSQPVKTQFYTVSTDGGLADVFIFIRSGLEGKSFATPSTPVMIDQTGCLYQPYIVGAMVKQKINFRNSDPVLHNIHPTPASQGNREINKAQMAGGPPIGISFDTPELPVRVKCDVHPWMFVYVYVADNPFFAVTDKDGNFTIANVPPGTYTLEAIHRKAGSATRGVEVKDGTVQQEFTLEVPSN
ncbi:MAG: hypothetical protein JWQ71_4776 [Pedosphaera sp.]|nr:hypothetical protein [Pedosphaera sp.]